MYQQIIPFLPVGTNIMLVHKYLYVCLGLKTTPRTSKNITYASTNGMFSRQANHKNVVGQMLPLVGSCSPILIMNMWHALQTMEQHTYYIIPPSKTGRIMTDLFFAMFPACVHIETFFTHNFLERGVFPG